MVSFERFVLNFITGTYVSLVFLPEPNLFKDFNKSLPPEDLANDFQTLRAILKSTPQFGNFLVGPDVTRIMNHSKSAIYLER